MKLLRIIIPLLVSIAFSPGVSAKEGKVKYSKSIEYRGSVTQKIPDGSGSFTAYSRVDGKAPLLKIDGTFAISPDNPNSLIVTDAKLAITQGLTVAAPKLTLTVNKEKEGESVNINAENCIISDYANTINSVAELSISLMWGKKGDKEWKFSIESSGIGNISNNFMPMDKVMARLNDQNETPVRQTVRFYIEQSAFIPNAPLGLRLLGVEDVLLSSGLKVIMGNETEYLYPFPNDNDFVIYNAIDVCSKLHLSFEDGNMEYDSTKLTVSYSNGDKYEANEPLQSAIYSNDILGLKSLKDLKFRNGTYQKTDGTSDTYKNDEIVSRSIAGGSVSIDDGGYSIKFDNGDTFIGTDRNFIKNPEDFLKFNSVNEVILNNGKLTKSPDTWDIYKGGIVTGGRWPLSDGGYVEYADNTVSQIYYPDGSKTVWADFEKNHPYSPNLSSKDYVIRNGSVQLPNGRTKRYENSQLVLTTVDDIDEYAERMGYKDIAFEISRVGTVFNLVDMIDGHLVFKTNNDAKQLNNSEFYLKVHPEYFFTYPKSYISTGYNAYDNPVLEAETCDINSLSPIKYYARSQSADGERRNQSMVWVYKPVAVKDNINYCKTIGLYIVEKATTDLQGSDKIICDLSNTFIKGHNRSFKKAEPTPKKKVTPKKKTYHEKGRVENCWNCSGTGQVKYWGPPWHMTCPECGGKGWYIEHEW